MSGLLVSVRSASEAETALAGGAALIDVKEPNRGALGRADRAVIREVVEAVAGRVPVSVALGELAFDPLPSAADLAGVAFAKFGLAGTDRDWRAELGVARLWIEGHAPGCRLVAVAYADADRAGSPRPLDVLQAACDEGYAALLIDTHDKTAGPLTAHLDAASLALAADRCRSAGVLLALAGSLDREQIAALREVNPDWFAVRGAVCLGGRDGTLSMPRVRALVEELARATPTDG